MSDAERGRDPETPPAADDPWWGGLGLVGAVALVAIGAGLLLWLVWGGSDAADAWSQYYGAAKVLAIGCVIAGATLLARRRERD
ncbi:hypothetical protein ACIREE_26565 [Streptomyces sp. NPDC102467]|uniref:hypothetical protein n=1 Tax=Streptomyces sp. NPDC102467 TaxID=3366179 RepID=UPI0037FFB638